MEAVGEASSAEKSNAGATMCRGTVENKTPHGRSRTISRSRRRADMKNARASSCCTAVRPEFKHCLLHKARSLPGRSLSMVAWEDVGPHRALAHRIEGEFMSMGLPWPSSAKDALCRLPLPERFAGKLPCSGLA